MSRLKTLEINKLLKELDYIESDFEYRTEVISEVDSEFIEGVNELLSLHPGLKELYDKKFADIVDESIANSKKEEIDIIDEIGDPVDDDMIEVDDLDEDINDKPNNKVKKLYRNIVKITHPDVTKKKKLNDIYIRATDYYDINNVVGLYKISGELNIDVEIDENDEYLIVDRLKKMKEKVSFLDSTFTWKWYETEDKAQKDQILLNFIKLRIL